MTSSQGCLRRTHPAAVCHDGEKRALRLRFNRICSCKNFYLAQTLLARQAAEAPNVTNPRGRAQMQFFPPSPA